MNVSQEDPYSSSEILIVNFSSLFLSPKLISSLGAIVLLLAISAIQWYLRGPKKLSLPIARKAKGGSDMTDALEEAKRMVS
jgi:hypothetical protein